MAAEATDTPKITSALGPDLKAVRQFITEMVTRGAIVLLIEAIVGLLARMRDLNTDLLGKLAQRRRAHPPSETLRRLQMELPFLRPSSDADPTSGGDPTKKKRKKLGAKNPRPHGRGKLPKHLPRVVQEHLVPDAERVCTRCSGPMKTVCFKCSERLELVPAHFVVLDVRREVVACGRADCHAEMRTAPKPDEIIDRGKLGPELAVQGNPSAKGRLEGRPRVWLGARLTLRTRVGSRYRHADGRGGASGQAAQDRGAARGCDERR